MSGDEPSEHVDVDLFLERELKRIRKDQVLAPGEYIQDVAIAAEGAYPGAFMVTNKGVVFHYTKLFARSRKLIRLGWSEITSVTVSYHRWIVRKRGKIILETSDPLGTIEFTRFESVDRAKAIAAAILSHVKQ